MTRGNTTYANPMAFTTDEQDGRRCSDPQPGIEKVFISVKAEGFRSSPPSRRSSNPLTPAVRSVDGRSGAPGLGDENATTLAGRPVLADSRILEGNSRKSTAVCSSSSGGPGSGVFLRTVAWWGRTGILPVQRPRRCRSPGVFGDGVIDVTLRPGMRLGEAKSRAGRPPTDSVVVVSAIHSKRRRQPAGSPRPRPGGTGIWEESAWIQPDGTSSSPSLPGGRTTQLHVLVDDFLSRTTTTDESSRPTLRKHAAGDVKVIEQPHGPEYRPGARPSPIRGDGDDPLRSGGFPPCPASWTRWAGRSKGKRGSPSIRTANSLGESCSSQEARCLRLVSVLVLDSQESGLLQPTAHLRRFQESGRRIREFAESAFLQVATDAEGVATVRGVCRRDGVFQRSRRRISDAAPPPLNPLSTPDFRWRGRASISSPAGPSR